MFIKKPLVRYVRTPQDVYDQKLQNWYFKVYSIAIVIFFFTLAICTNGTSAGTEEVKLPVVDQIAHKEIKGPKYTIRLGLSGARKIIPELSEDTVELRTRRFLDIYGIEHTFDIWKRYSQEYKIDYTLPVCIAWADSHLGHATLTKNNIGNVGNNDRGDKVEFKSLDSGIKAIFSTLNNRYLGKYTKVGELSNEGRKRSKLPACGKGNYCYATSEGVWSTNVTNCLKILQDRDVAEDFAFRR